MENWLMVGRLAVAIENLKNYFSLRNPLIIRFREFQLNGESISK